MISDLKKQFEAQNQKCKIHGIHPIYTVTYYKVTFSQNEKWFLDNLVFLSAESESVRTGVQCASIPFALPNRHI